MNEIIINDVTLRDGLQNEPYFVPTEDKARLINFLIDAGIKHLEITSFVRPDVIPQLKDNFELANNKELKDAHFSALIPNLKGFQKLTETNIEEAVFFISACELHNQENVRKSIDESLKDLSSICDFAKKINTSKRIKVSISMVFGSPFTRSLPEDKNLFKIIDFALENCIHEITLSDTWGNADEQIFLHQLKKIINNYPEVYFSLHLHNIANKGLKNLEIGLREGILKFDTSLAGIGGCPFSTEKGGNIDISEALKIVEKLNLNHNVNLEKLKFAENFFRNMKKYPLS
jgi:hydroxymethylglutaryl-CoA lyase